MSKFQTIVHIPQYEWKINYGSPTMFMGSCFAENIGGKMGNLKFQVDQNPCGILYNPVSVANSLQFLLDKKKFGEHELISHQGLWHSFYHHSRFSSPEKKVALNSINKRLKLGAQNLLNAGFLFITFGTAWVYEYKETLQIVSNCHKIPSSSFTRYRLKIPDVVERYKTLLQDILKVNPSIKIIFTVSPIRHWKDGAIENQLSKSTLLLAVNQIISEVGRGHCAYFPSYEIIMDELRDYRFYSEDMLHLSTVATGYIWEKFERAFMEENTLGIKKEVEKIIRAKNHKPFNPATEEHQRFLSNYLGVCKKLETKHTNINLKLEIEYFEKQLKHM